MWRRAVSHRPQTNLSLLGLAPSGGYRAIRITADAGGLLHHRFTITPAFTPGLFVSVALIRQVSPPRMLSDAVLFGVRTFLDGALRHRDRPTDLRQHHDTRNEKVRQHRKQVSNKGYIVPCTFGRKRCNRFLLEKSLNDIKINLESIHAQEFL